jgi:hypothetical protein
MWKPEPHSSTAQYEGSSAFTLLMHFAEYFPARVVPDTTQGRCAYPEEAQLRYEHDCWWCFPIRWQLLKAVSTGLKVNNKVHLLVTVSESRLHSRGLASLQVACKVKVLLFYMSISPTNRQMCAGLSPSRKKHGATVGLTEKLRHILSDHPSCAIDQYWSVAAV